MAKLNIINLGEGTEVVIEAEESEEGFVDIPALGRSDFEKLR